MTCHSTVLIWLPTAVTAAGSAVSDIFNQIATAI